MSTIQLGLREHNVPDKNPFARGVVAKAAGEPDLSDPDLTPAEFTTGAAPLEAALAAPVVGRKEARRLTQVFNDNCSSPLATIKIPRLG